MRHEPSRPRVVRDPPGGLGTQCHALRGHAPPAAVAGRTAAKLPAAAAVAGCGCICVAGANAGAGGGAWRGRCEMACESASCDGVMVGICGIPVGKPPSSSTVTHSAMVWRATPESMLRQGTRLMLPEEKTCEVLRQCSTRPHSLKICAPHGAQWKRGNGWPQLPRTSRRLQTSAMDHWAQQWCGSRRCRHSHLPRGRC